MLSAETARTDLRIKLPEYKAIAALDTIVFVDIATERLHVVQRAGRGAWGEQVYDEPVDLELPAIGITIPHDEIFARD